MQQLLDADDHTTGMFLTGAGSDSLAQDLADESVPDRIGPFTILEELGRGGMGVVYEAEQDHPRRRVALKTLHPHLRTEQASALFRFEAQALGNLLHPGIPQVYAADEEDGLVYLVMELVRGQPLNLAMEPGGDDIERRVRLLAKIADAVHHAHLAGILHRDLKPQNVLLTPAGQPKVLDFGIAAMLEARAEQAAGVVGTLAYASPEQLDGRPTTVATDVYALGVLGYELFTGVLPHETAGLTPDQAARRKGFHPMPTCARRTDLPADLGWLLDRALEPDPAARPASVADLAADLRRVLRMEPLPGRGGLAYRARLGLQRNRGRVLGVAVVGLGVLAVVGFSGLQERWTEQQRTATAQRQLEVLEASLAPLTTAEEADWGEAEALFDSFVQLPEVQGTPALSTAWRKHAARRLAAGQDGTLDALTRAWTLAPTPETTHAAARALAIELNRTGRHASAAQVLQTLPETELGDLGSEVLLASVATRDFDRALASVGPDDEALRGVLGALGRVQLTELQSVGATLVTLGQPPTPYLLTIEPDRHVVVRTRDGSETLGRIPHPEGFDIRSPQLFAHGDTLFFVGKPEGQLQKPTVLFRSAVDPETGAPGPWEAVAEPAFGTPTAVAVASGLAYIGHAYPQRVVRAVDLETWEVTDPVPETANLVSDVSDLMRVDLDGDGRDELASSFTDWLAYEVRAWRHGPAPTLEPLGVDQVGYVTGLARVRRGEDADLLAAMKTNQRPRETIFGAADPYGPVPGIYLYGLEDDALTRLRRLPIPSPQDHGGSSSAGGPWTGDLDGDGRDDLVAPLSDYIRRDQADLLLVADVASPDARGFLIEGVWLQGVVDADGDGDHELVVRLDGGPLALLGTGDAPVPLFDDPSTAPSATLTPPDGMDPATARTWSRAERLLQLGLPDATARVLHDLARRHGVPAVRARAHHEAAVLYEQLGDDHLASTTWQSALEDVEDPALERAIRQGAIETLTRRLKLPEALAIAAAGSSPVPDWLDAAASAPAVTLMGSEPLDSRWRVHQPIALNRLEVGWELDQFNRLGVLLETDVELTGDRLGLDLDLVTKVIEPASGLRIQLVDPADNPVLDLHLMSASGGRGNPNLELDCLCDESRGSASRSFPANPDPIHTRIQTEWLAGPELRGCLVSWLPEGVDDAESSDIELKWRPVPGELPTGPHTLRILAGGIPEYKLAMRTRQHVQNLVLHGARWPDAPERTDVERARLLLANGEYAAALPLLDDAPAERALAAVRLGKRDITRQALADLIAADDQVALAALYRVEGPFLGGELAELLGDGFGPFAAAVYHEPFVSQSWREDLQRVALSPEFEQIEIGNFETRVFAISRAQLLYKGDYTAQAIRLARIAANAPPDPSHPNDLVLRVQTWTVLADMLAISEPDEAVASLKEALALSHDPVGLRRTVRQFPKLAPLLATIEAENKSP